jgi:EmrB/QacA subfamily drug resistance transporter
MGVRSLPQTKATAWWSLVSVAFGIMMVQIDATVVAIANPAIALDLGAGLEGIQWVTTGYLLVLAGLFIPAGTMADRIGHHKAFVIGVGGFAVASLLCGLSGSIEMLIGARVLQGMFGALAVPAALAVIRAAFPPEKLAMGIGVFSSVVSLSMAAGPIFGGLLVQYASWPWVFLLNVPFGLVSVVIGLLVRGKEQRNPAPVDLPGALTLTLAMVSVVWGITRVPTAGWLSVPTLGFLALGLVLAGVFVAVERKSRHPMVPLSLFANRSISVGSVLMTLTMMAFFAVLFYLTFYLQGVQGKSGVMAGVALLPLTLVFVISAPAGGWLTNTLGVRGTLVVGACCIAVTLILLLRLDVDSGFWTLGPALLIYGFGAGFMMVAATKAIVGSAPADKVGVASGVQQSMSQLGGLLGTSVFGSLIASVVRPRSGFLDPQAVELGFPPSAQQELARHVPAEQATALTRAAHDLFVDGLHTVFAVGIGVAVVAALLSLLVTEPKVPADTP